MHYHAGLELEAFCMHGLCILQYVYTLSHGSGLLNLRLYYSTQSDAG